MSVKMKMVVKNKEEKKEEGKRVKCKCGQKLTITAMNYHKLRCDVYKNSRNVPYPVEKVDKEFSDIKQHEDNKWIEKLVYRCKIGEVTKIVVPTKKEMIRVSSMCRYYAKKRNLVAFYRTEKIWRGINLFVTLKEK